MKKVLFVSVKNIECGGVESFILNWIKNLPADQYELFWFFPGVIKSESVADKLLENGVTLIQGKQTKNKIIKYICVFSSIYKIVKINKISIVHVNTGNVFINAVALLAARIGGADIRISHSHSAGACNTNKAMAAIQCALRCIVNSCATKRVACSEIAAEALFGKRKAKTTFILKNAIDVKKFSFSYDARETIRHKFGIEDCFVIGQIARLSAEKNQKFMIDVFKKIFDKESKARLILVGDGSMFFELSKYVRNLGLEKYVLFAGTTPNPEIYYSAMDIFMLTSFFEGLPLTGIEAQASGLPCIFSDCITKEIEILETCKFLSLNLSADTWANEVLLYKNYALENRKIAYSIVESKGYGLDCLKHAINSLYDK